MKMMRYTVFYLILGLFMAACQPSEKAFETVTAAQTPVAAQAETTAAPQAETTSAPASVSASATTEAVIPVTEPPPPAANGSMPSSTASSSASETAMAAKVADKGLLEPIPGIDLQRYRSEAGGFELLVPATWSISKAEVLDYGTRIQFDTGSAAKNGGNAVIIAESAVWTPDKLAEKLCGGCTPPALEEVLLNGNNARRAVISVEGGPALEWLFIQHQGRLIGLSLHDPATHEPLDGLTQTFSFVAIPPDAPGLNPAALAARRSLAEQLGKNPYTIVIAAAEQRQWADACMGVVEKGETCAQAVTTGYEGLLQAAGQTVAFHADEKGDAVRFLPEAALAARQALADKLGTSLFAIEIINVTQVDWADACLGVPVEGMMCAQVITPGYRVVLEAGGRRYEYHTDKTGGRTQEAKVTPAGN